MSVIATNPLVDESTEEVIDGDAESFALDVEEGGVDGRDGLVGDAANLSLCGAVEIQLDALGLERIPTDDKGAYVFDRGLEHRVGPHAIALRPAVLPSSVWTFTKFSVRVPPSHCRTSTDATFILTSRDYGVVHYGRGSGVRAPYQASAGTRISPRRSFSTRIVALSTNHRLRCCCQARFKTREIVPDILCEGEEIPRDALIGLGHHRFILRMRVRYGLLRKVLNAWWNLGFLRRSL